MTRYAAFGAERLEEIKAIYAEEGWSAYLRDDERLKKAFEHSLYCLGAFDERDTLCGFVRCVGDGGHIVMVQDLIVAKGFRGQGIGKTLFKAAWDRYADVRMFEVVTDIEDEKANRFYQSFGMKKLSEGCMTAYFR